MSQKLGGKNAQQDMMSSLMNGGVGIIKKMMPFADRAMAEGFIDKMDLIKDGGELMHAAITHGKKDIVELLIERGCDIHFPPEII